MGDADAVRFMLRSEIRSSSEIVISCGLDLTERTIFVVTDWHPPIGTAVSLRLSFPTVVAPVELAARVAANRAAGGPGEPGGVELVFEDSSREAAAAVAAQLQRLSASALTAPAGAARTYRVLLVEDSGFIRDMFAYGMASSFDPPGAVAIDHAEDAERAWQKLREGSYDLLIVDYFLPAEDGASLIARLRRDERLAQVTVVAISVGGAIARDATIAAGADLYLDKPLVFRDLLHTMRLLARREGSAPDTKRRAILVLDDSPLVLAVTRYALEAAGFEVAIAEDLSSFERLRTSFAPDLILVDVQMPEAFGDDVASTLRGWHGVRVPILLVSSLDEAELARRAKRADVSGYVLKNAGMTALVDRCKQLLGSAA
ncbi:MAG TPA: response regulator [Kofleriaceae bacterium]|nr:response regulator [Kofleriaceae bacterium]